LAFWSVGTRVAGVQNHCERKMVQNTKTLAEALCWVHGLYYLVTGVWPIVSVKTFQLVTGPKSDHLTADPPTEADHWMLNTIAALITAISVVLLAAAGRRRVTFDVALLALLSAGALTIIDIVYVGRGTIASIYLADAAIEVLLIGGWGWLLAKGKLPAN
jgi:hypothetical protein